MWNNIFYQGKNLTVVIAETDEERKVAYHLRYLGYKQAGYINNKFHHIIDGCLFDSYDFYSTIFVLLLDEQPIGTVRLTMAKNGPLEIEELIDISKQPHYLLSCEFGRLTILKQYRKKGYSLLLTSSAAKFSREQNCHWLYIETKKNGLCPYYEKFGIASITNIAHPKFNTTEAVLMFCNLGAPHTIRRLFYRFIGFSFSYLAVHCDSLLRLILRLNPGPLIHRVFHSNPPPKKLKK
jgi:GNAT superfamily N-acetyltransferase